MKDEKFLEIIDKNELSPRSNVRGFEFLSDDNKTVLIIASDPLDFDCLGSGLILKKYLESLGKIVTLMWPGEATREDRDYFRFLPYFNEVIFKDTREILKKKNFDVLILVDGSSLVQFYDTSKTIDNPPDLSIYDTRIHIDHHLDNGQVLGTYTIRDVGASAATKIILEKIVPRDFIDEKLATLGYSAILWDTGNFQWQFNDGTLEIADFLLQKGAEVDFLLNKLYSSYPKLRLEMLSLAIKNIEYDDKLKTLFLFLPYQTFQEEKLDENKFKELREVFVDEIAGKITGYDRGILIYEKEPNKIKISARGNNLYNKINLPKILSELTPQGGGHFNAAGAETKGDFEEIKKALLETIQKYLQK
ncbi:MAG: DHHA1 domain-containing protein [Candidatus Daviesbacteria bacterium]|nr:DHHA1 domain-containing protein [Candidatus Daviesbacteria bacterium]